MARDGTYMIFGESVLGKLAMTFLMAMVPVVELRGAIPMGVAAGLPPAVAAVTAMAGNLSPVPCILLLLRRVFALMRKSAWLGPKVDRLERRAHLKGRKVRKYRTLGLVLLVAIQARSYHSRSPRSPDPAEPYIDCQTKHGLPG